MTSKVRAYAKINLTLEVLGRRSDGYHEVSTIMQTIGLWDTLSIEPAKGLELYCSVPELQSDDNLVWQAAHRLRYLTATNQGASIQLEKRIPAAMGFGGGSSDAAATLLALNRAWELGLSFAQLADVASGLGSDVTFFLSGGTAIASGRGEVVTSLPPISGAWVLLICPPWSGARKTASLYRMLQPDDYSDGSATHRMAQSITAGQFCGEGLCNVFDSVAPAIFDILQSARQAMVDAGASNVHLCGSGPGLFSLVPSQSHGERSLGVLQHAGWEAYLVKTTQPEG